MKTQVLLSAAIIASIFMSCSNQRYVSGETDDLYFTASDRYTGTENEFATVNEVDGADYMSPSEQATESGYFIKGKAARNDQNPNAADAYQNYTQASSGIQFDTNSGANNTNAGDGTTINNFYGNTTYYEEDNFEDSYASRIRRFDNVNMGLGYGYYDPFFVDPFWSYGWSAWNPYPRGGWSIGWNSWSGWNVGYGWGWGNPRWGWGVGPAWGVGWNNCWGIYDPWCGWGSPYAGWGFGGWGNPYGGWGMNNYWAGYNNGYWNGYNDGLWLGAGSNQRGVSVGRRGLATDRGFGNGSRAANESPNKVVQNNNSNASKMAAGRIESPSVNDRSKDISSRSNNTLLADGSKLYQVPAQRSKINQASEAKAVKMQDANANAARASERYKEAVVNRPTAVSKDKYNASGLTRTSREQLIDMNRAQQRQQINSNSAPGKKMNAPTRDIVRPQNNVRTSPNRNYSTPRDRANERPRYYTPNRNQGQQINRSNSRSNYTPQRSTSPSRNYNQGNTRSNTRMSTPNRSNVGSSSPSRSRSNYSPSRSSSPSRNFTPSRSSSPSRNFSTPSRSSSPSRSISPSRSGGGRR